jgi:putative membrane protein
MTTTLPAGMPQMVVGPQEAWGAWGSDPLAALLLVVAGGWYLLGVERVWRRTGRGRVVHGWQVWAFAMGWGALAVALVSPVEALAGTLLTAHMGQHLLLTLVAAPLLVLGAPVLPMVTALPAAVRRPVHQARVPVAWRRRLTSPIATAVACGTYIVVLWVWHLPVLYEAALGSSAIHVVEHATMLGTAAWLWSTVLQRGGPVRRLSGLAAPALFVTAVLTVGLAALLTFSPAAWYGTYAAGAQAWGLTALEDQQRAGAIMWSLGGIVTMAAGAVAFWAWVVGEQRRRGDDHRGPGTPIPAVPDLGRDVPERSGVGRSSAKADRDDEETA